MIHHVQQHAKFRRLVRRLRPLLDGSLISPDTTAVGLLERLWHATIVNAYRGDIGKLDDEAIAEAIGWHGEPTQIVDLLVECGWLDRDEEYRLIVHDWDQHAPRHVKGNAKRHGGFVRASLRESSPEEDSPGESRETIPPPNPTRQDPTEPDPTGSSTSMSTTIADVDDEPLLAPEPDPARVPWLISKVGRIRSGKDAELAWKLTAAQRTIGEAWLIEAVEGVATARPATPWAYLWTSLKEGAKQRGHNLGAVLRGISPPPAGWRPGLNADGSPLPTLSRDATPSTTVWENVA